MRMYWSILHRKRTEGAVKKVASRRSKVVINETKTNDNNDLESIEMSSNKLDTTSSSSSTEAEENIHLSSRREGLRTDRKKTKKLSPSHGKSYSTEAIDKLKAHEKRVAEIQRLKNLDSSMTASNEESTAYSNIDEEGDDDDAKVDMIVLSQSSINSFTEIDPNEEKSNETSQLTKSIVDVTSKVSDSQGIQECDLHAAEALVSISQEIIAEDSDVHQITTLSSTTMLVISPPDETNTSPVVNISKDAVIRVENTSVTKSTFDEEDDYSEWNPKPCPIEELEDNNVKATSEAKISEKRPTESIPETKQNPVDEAWRDYVDQ